VKVEWRPLARQDLDETLAYVADDNPDAANRLQDEIERQVEMLAKMPEMGRPGRRRGTRELVIAGTRYIAAYRLTQNRLEILRLLHGARHWPSRF